MKNFTKTIAQHAGLLVFPVFGILIFSGCNSDSKSPVSSVAAATVTPAAAKAAESPVSRVMADASTILGRPEVPILCYHQIRDYKATDSKTAKAYIAPPDRFTAQIKALADSGYHAILPDELYDYLAYGKALPSKPIMLTFDDTRVDQFDVARTVLQKYGYKGVYFIMTVSLGRPGYMTKEQVKQLSDEGNTIGSHTWDHHNVKLYTGNDWVTQIEKPSKQLEAITGKRIDYFAYPFGLWNKEGIPHLKEHGFKIAMQLYAKRDDTDPLFTVRRIIVPGEWSPEGLQKVIKKDFIKP
jgi:peptidoglycan/xylan/chitin deacetylase (PgdA/CDA1 family)